VLALAAQTLAFDRPAIDWHAVAPELVLLAAGVLATLVDVWLLERGRRFAPSIAGVGFLAALIPVITLALDGQDRVMFGGAWVVDDASLVFKALFLLTGYLVVLLSTNYMAEGDYWESEYYSMLLASVLGMLVMASSRDLISIFIALELLSIPAYMMAAWRKRDVRGNEAGLKYYLMGVFASAIFLYGMSLVYGLTGSTLLVDINAGISNGETVSALTLAIVFIIVGFAFKVSAVPFHTWAPDTYEGAPTPVAAFLSVASKAAGFVALVALLLVGFYGRSDVFEPVMWVLAALSVTVGNLIALRQTNIVRMMAYSGVAQAGFLLAPFAVAASGNGSGTTVLDDAGGTSLSAIVIYLIIYAVMNLGAFAVIIAMARKTGSAEIDSFAGSFQYAPALTVAMTVFMFSLAGIPPLGGWFAKLGIFRSLIAPDTAGGYSLAIILAVNSVIALFYYARISKVMWMDPVAHGDETPVKVPTSLSAAAIICVIATLVFGIYPRVFDNVGDFVECPETEHSLVTDWVDEGDVSPCDAEGVAASPGE
jgi:NADH-quinone oxidoreductase subunit N